MVETESLRFVQDHRALECRERVSTDLGKNAASGHRPVSPPGSGCQRGSKNPSVGIAFLGVHWEIEEMNPRVFKLFMLRGSFVQVCLAHVKCRLRSQGREQSHFRGPPGGQITETSRPWRQGSEDPGCTGGCSPQASKSEDNLLARR